MASPPLPQSQHQVSYNEFPDHEQDIPAQPEDEENYEAAEAEVFPTAPGEEDVMLQDSDRPVSAGTTNGLDYDTAAYSDSVEEIINNYGAQTGSYATEDLESSAGNYLSRPEVPRDPDANEGFQFGKTDQQQAQFNATRQSTAQPITLISQSMDQDATPLESPPAVQTENVHAYAPFEPATGVLTDGETVASHGTAPLDHEGSERKRKKKKTRSKLTQSEEPQMEATQSTVYAAQANAVNLESGNADPSDRETDHEPDVIKIEESQSIQDHKMIQDERNEQGKEQQGWPHTQLQDDLDAAVHMQPQHVEDQLPASINALPGYQEEDEAPQGTMVQGNGLQGDDYTTDAQTLAKRHSPAVPSRVQKRMQRPSRTAANKSQSKSNGDTGWQLDDYAKLFVLKAKESEQEREAAFASQLEASYLEVQKANESVTAIQGNLDQVLLEKRELLSQFNNQGRKLSSYETKFGNFKKFVDGIGKDLDSFKKQSISLRRRTEEVIAETTSVTGGKLALWDQAEDRLESCHKIRIDAVKIARELNEQLNQVVPHRDQLQRELSTTVGVLSEERDRCAKLRNQLEESERKLHQVVESHQNFVLDKLHIIHAAVEDEQSKNDTKTMIEELALATQAMSTPTDSAMQDIATVKALVESLDKRVNSSVEAAEVAEANSRTHFDEAFKAIQDQVADREKLTESHQSVVHGLQEQLNACNGRIAKEEAQKSAVQRQADELSESNATLQTKISALQSKITPAENVQFQLNETKVELEHATTSLGSVKAELETKAEELRTLTLANTSLRDQLQALQDRLQNVQTHHADSIPNEELQRVVRDVEQRVRQEMADHVETFETQLKAKTSNELKKLNSEKSRLEKHMKRLQDELASIRCQLNEAQSKKPAAMEALEQELERARKHSQAQKGEIESLHSTVNDLKASSTDTKALHEKLSTLFTQLNADQAKLKRSIEYNTELQRQLKRLEDVKDETELAREQALEEVTNLRLESESKLTALQKELEEAKENAERCSAGLESFQQSCDTAINHANQENERKLHAVHKQLTESQAELQNARQDSAAFRESVEQIWKNEKDEWQKVIAEATQRTAEVEGQKAEAQATHETAVQQMRDGMNEQRTLMQQQNDELRESLRAAEAKLQLHQRPFSRESKSSSRLRVPSLKDGITPSASARSAEPPKLRKTVNCSRSEVTDAGPILAPDAIRPISRQMNSADSQAAKKGSIVEEMQNISDPFAAYQIGPPDLRQQSSFSIFSDDRNGGIEEDQPDPESPTIPETQMDDNLPSFAQINNSLRSNVTHVPFLSSTTQTATLSNSQTGTGLRDIDGVHSHYNDQQTSGGLSQSQGVQTNGHSRQQQPFSKDEIEKYTYRRPVPQSNSGSKRAPSNETSATLLSYSQSEMQSSNERYKTPVRDAQVVTTQNANRVLSSSQGSSPAFIREMQDASNKRRKSTTYGPPGNSAGKQQASESDVGHIKDPRLIGRDQAAGTKRKAYGEITEGYEHERKKRIAAGAKAESRGGPQHPQSIKDLPSGNTRRSSSQTHMQTFAGGNSRTTRTTRNGLKNDQVSASARFDQVLSRRR